jgi:polyisoprenoid-binding protein YceI
LQTIRKTHGLQTFFPLQGRYFAMYSFNQHVINMQRNPSLLLMLTFLALPALLSAQRLFTRDAKVYFDATSRNSPERVDATNKSGTLVIDVATNKVQAAVLMTNFVFEKALMQEHFNENYVESSKYPKATFKGKITDPSNVNFSKDGSYTVSISGEMSMHGVKKTITTPATINIKGGTVTAITTFESTLEPMKK